MLIRPTRGQLPFRCPQAMRHFYITRIAKILKTKYLRVNTAICGSSLPGLCSGFHVLRSLTAIACLFLIDMWQNRNIFFIFLVEFCYHAVRWNIKHVVVCNASAGSQWDSRYTSAQEGCTKHLDETSIMLPTLAVR